MRRYSAFDDWVKQKKVNPNANFNPGDYYECFACALSRMAIVLNYDREDAPFDKDLLSAEDDEIATFFRDNNLWANLWHISTINLEAYDVDPFLATKDIAYNLFSFRRPQ